jgi:dethiobiotin synthetase
LSPHQAARLSGRPPLKLAEAVQRIVDLEAAHDLVIVEGAGGLLVPFDEDDRWTLVDLACSLNAPAVVVVHPGLGTLNHTALTVECMRSESVRLDGIVIGSWPENPDLAMRANLADLAAMAPVVGALPAGMAAMKDFRSRARASIAPRFGGRFSWRSFLAANRA